MARKLTTDEFIRKARAVHGEKYDYSTVNYIGNNVKVEIICISHGKFLQKPNDHLSKHGCPFCANELNSRTKLKTLDKFISNAIKEHHK